MNPKRFTMGEEALAGRLAQADARARPATGFLQLARPTDGARYRRATLIVDREGALTLSEHEMGGAPSAVWGLDEMELTLSVSPGHVGRLALALVAELLGDGEDAVRRLAELCEEHNVPYRVASWS